jgi:hypothetical protein
MKTMMTTMTMKKKRTAITNPASQRLLRLVASAFLAVLLVAPALFAFAPSSDKHSGEPYALIYATVWDSQSRTAYGVKVQLRRAGDKKVIAEQISNHSGEAAFRVPAGKRDYLLTADVKASKGKTKPEATAHVENDERVEVSLHLTE